MKTKLFAIAKITRATGLKGDVSIRPLIRQFDEYVDRDLFIGFDKNFAKDVKLTNVSGTNKKPRFRFEGLDSRDDAEAMIGQLLFASIHEKDPINLISPDLIGATVVTVSGEQIGELADLFEIYETKDGAVMIILIATDEVFTKFCNIYDLNLHKDERFINPAARVINLSLLTPLVNEATKKLSSLSLIHI